MCHEKCIFNETLKRPTGKFVAIIERSRRRDGIVGIYDAKQWISSMKDYTENCMTIKPPLSFSSMEYISIIPTNSKFPRMMAHVRSLPDLHPEMTRGW